MFHLFDKIRYLFHSHKQRYCQLWYLQGRLDERTEVLKQQSLPGLSGLPDVPTIDLAEQPIQTEDPVPTIPGTRLHAWGQVHRPGYRPVRLLPAPAVQHTDFPWLPDDHSLNSRLSALHELLGCYAETEVKLKAVKALPERNKR